MGSLYGMVMMDPCIVLGCVHEYGHEGRHEHEHESDPLPEGDSCGTLDQVNSGRNDT